MNLRSQKGSAAVEFAVSATLMSFLILAVVQFFFLIQHSMENVLEARRRTFEILEGIDGSNGCDNPLINAHMINAKEIQIAVPDAARKYTFWAGVLRAISVPQSLTAWVGHKSCAGGSL